MRILGLDIGKKRTGVAFVDDAIEVPLALDTMKHESEQNLVADILQLCDERDIDKLVIGLPLLPSGSEGSQSAFVRTVGTALAAAGIDVDYLDERYTTSDEPDVDGDAKAACQLLLTYLQRS